MPILCSSASFNIKIDNSNQIADVIFTGKFENSLAFLCKHFTIDISSRDHSVLPKMREFRSFKYRKNLANDVNVLFSSTDTGPEFDVHGIKNLLKSQNKAVVFIEGVTGIGKTYFCQHFAKKWPLTEILNLLSN
jgi:phosphate starvation-inducible protein PhoH